VYHRRFKSHTQTAPLVCISDPIYFVKRRKACPNAFRNNASAQHSGETRLSEFRCGEIIMCPSKTEVHDQTCQRNQTPYKRFIDCHKSHGVLTTSETTRRGVSLPSYENKCVSIPLKRRNINARHLGLILRFPMTSIYTTGSN
jgi:hypothetical protein